MGLGVGEGVGGGEGEVGLRLRGLSSCTGAVTVTSGVGGVGGLPLLGGEGESATADEHHTSAHVYCLSEAKDSRPCCAIKIKEGKNISTE